MEQPTERERQDLNRPRGKREAGGDNQGDEQEGREARPDEKIDLQSKTGNRFDTKQGRQDQKIKHRKLRESNKASTDHNSLQAFQCSSFCFSLVVLHTKTLLF